MKLGKNAKYNLKIKENAEILAQEIFFKNEEISWKEYSHTPTNATWVFISEKGYLHE